MRTKTVHKVRIVGPLEEEKEIVGTIHEIGSLHIDKVEEGQLEQETSQAGVEEVSNLLLHLSFIKEVSTIYNPPTIETLPELHRVLAETHSFLDTHKDFFTTKDTKRQKKHRRLDVLNERVKQLQRLPKEFMGKNDLLLFSSEEVLDDIPEEGVNHIRRKRHYYSITATGLAKARVAKAFHQSPGSKIDLSFVKSSPSEALQTMRKEIKDLESQINSIMNHINSYAEDITVKFSYLYATLKNHYDRLTISNNFAKSETLVTIEGFAEPEDALKIAKKLPSCNVYTEEVEDAPTKLGNQGAYKSFEPITKMFDTPKYKQFDPTTVVSLFYPLFFGIMLSDIGYGLFLLALMPLLPRFIETDVKKYQDILGLSALSTILFGVLFGSFFGDLVPLEPLLLDPFQDSFTILLGSLVLGLIHMNLGVAIAFYQHIKNDSSGFETAKDVLPLPLIEVGVLSLVYSFVALGSVMLLIALSLLVAKKGALGILDVTDYLGTWFSYARLLALSLATAGIALAVNIISAQVSSLGIMGIIISIFILILGHIFNFALNTLGTAINAARLHYVEFFGLFFDGGGESFEPFKIKVPTTT